MKKMCKIGDCKAGVIMRHRNRFHLNPEIILKTSSHSLEKLWNRKNICLNFSLSELRFKRALFILNINHIAKQAKASFERFFGRRIKTGLVSGVKPDYEADFVFVTVQI